jgi:uncharacterized damage-inducible protein DinB
MDVQSFTTRFSGNLETIQSLVTGVSEEQIRWKPSPKGWSILEVVNHLYDEERGDFRKRLDYLLHRPGEAWPPIDTEGWAIEREYNKKDPEDSLEQFRLERQQSLSWLQGLGEIDWDQFHEHPKLGKMRAGDLLASWLAHDYLHMRQLVGLHHAYGVELGKPYDTAYAGGW